MLLLKLAHLCSRLIRSSRNSVPTRGCECVPTRYIFDGYGEYRKNRRHTLAVFWPSDISQCSQNFDEASKSPAIPHDGLTRLNRFFR